MKKYKLLISILILFMMVPFSVFAAGSITVNQSQITLTTGGSASFNISANNAAGRVDISSSNPQIATVSKSSEWLDNTTSTVTVVGKQAGTAKITIVVTDAATYDEEEINRTYTINVTVNNPAPSPTPTPTPTPTPPKPVISPITGDDRSSNNDLKTLSVENHKVEKVDEQHYALQVKNSIEKIKIVAEPVDEKATVKGAGEVPLQLGENNFEIIVTAENQATKNYYLKVTRKNNQYSLDKIEEAIKDNEEDVTVTIKKGEELSKENLEKIKQASKKIEFVYYNENNEKVYNLLVDGNKLNAIETFKPDAQLAFKEIDSFDALSGYRKGIYLQLLDTKQLLEGMTLMIPLDNQFSEGDKVNIYSYNVSENSIKLIKKNAIVKDGTVEITNRSSNHFFISKADIHPLKGNTPHFIIIFILVLLMIVNTMMIVMNRKKKNS